MTSSVYTDRLDFSLPDFTRVAWVSEQARREWQPRLARIGSAWQTIERLSVLERRRACTLTRLSPEQFPVVAAWAVTRGLVALPLGVEGTGAQMYAATPEPYVAGGTLTYPTAIGEFASVQAFERAWHNNDHSGIGELLGYPKCCQEFFVEHWVDQRLVDTTWPMASRSSSAQFKAEGTVCTIPRSSLATPLYRWLGVRFVSHLPCSFECEPSLAIARSSALLGRDAGFLDEVDWAETILGWDVEWDANHGIAEIRTPIAKVTSRTDATARRYRVRCHGWQPAPPEAPSGTRFPYRNQRLHTLTQSRAFRRGMEKAGEGTLTLPAPDEYRQNGFSTFHAMDLAHRLLLRVVSAELTGQAGTVLDLGAGNGRLVMKLCAGTALRYLGIELDASKARSTDSGNIVSADLFDMDSWGFEGDFAAVLLMIGRLFEVSRSRADALLERLRARTKLLVLYTYDRQTALEFPQRMEAFHLEGAIVSAPEDPATVAIVRF